MTPRKYIFSTALQTSPETSLKGPQEPSSADVAPPAIVRAVTRQTSNAARAFVRMRNLL